MFRASCNPLARYGVLLMLVAAAPGCANAKPLWPTDIPALSSDTLTRLTNDADPQVRGYAAVALARRGDTKAVPELIRLLEDDAQWDYCVRRGLTWCRIRVRVCETAHEAIEYVTGESMPFDPSEPVDIRRRKAQEWKAHSAY